MTFAQWQPRYAEAGIALIPAKPNKGAAVHNWPKIGPFASRSLIARFGQCEAFGFVAGEQSRITVLDIDTPDEKVLADALSRYGHTPVVARSGSGNWHAYYRYNGEGRRIKHIANNIDLLGDGFVIAPPSRINRRTYRFVQGSLDDLASLPVMRNVDPVTIEGQQTIVPKGQRNDWLFRALLREARHCDSYRALLDVAHTKAEATQPPLSKAEVAKITRSAWRYEKEGINWAGTGKRIVIPFSEIDTLMMNFPDAFLLKIWLQRYRGASNSFRIANAMRECLPGGSWSVARMQAARRALREKGVIEKLHPDSSYHGPAVYRFSKVRKT